MKMNTKTKAGLGILGLLALGTGVAYWMKDRAATDGSSTSSATPGETTSTEETATGALLPGSGGAGAAKGGALMGAKGTEAKSSSSVMTATGGSVAAVGASGGAAPATGTPQGATAGTSAAVVTPPEELPACRRFSFASTNSPQRHEKNQLSAAKLLKESSGDAKTLCLRVDGTPVKHELDAKTMEISFASVRRADSRVSVSFCRTGVKCEESCVIPRDEFLEALTGTADGSDDDSNDGGGWAASKEEQELETQIAGFQKTLKEGKIKGTNSKWSIQGEPEACGTKVANLRGH